MELPPGFEDPKRPNHVYKLHKALYGLSKLLEHGMNALRIFISRTVLKWAKLIVLSLLTKLIMIYLFAKYMSMTLYLAQLTKNFVESLVGS